MDRRTLLKVLGSLPFIGLALPKRAEAGSISLPAAKSGEMLSPESAGVYFDLSPIEMGWKLAANLRAYRDDCDKRFPDNSEPAKSWELLEAISRRIPFELRREQENENHQEPYSLSSLMFFPEQDPALLKRVRFGVMESPVAITKHPVSGREVVLRAYARKVRALWNLDAVQDLAAFSGIDADCEIVGVVSQQVVLEIANECRHQFKETGQVPSMYALYMTPTISPSLLDPKDFSVCRSLRMRYAKCL